MKNIIAAFFLLSLSLNAASILPIDYTTAYSPTVSSNRMSLTVDGYFTNSAAIVLTTNRQIGDSLPVTAQKINWNFSQVSSQLKSWTNWLSQSGGTNYYTIQYITNIGDTTLMLSNYYNYTTNFYITTNLYSVTQTITSNYYYVTNFNNYGTNIYNISNTFLVNSNTYVSNYYSAIYYFTNLYTNSFSTNYYYTNLPSGSGYYLEQTNGSGFDLTITNHISIVTPSSYLESTVVTNATDTNANGTYYNAGNGTLTNVNGFVYVPVNNEAMRSINLFGGYSNVYAVVSGFTNTAYNGIYLPQFDSFFWPPYDYPSIGASFIRTVGFEQNLYISLSGSTYDWTFSLDLVGVGSGHLGDFVGTTYPLIINSACPTTVPGVTVTFHADLFSTNINAAYSNSVSAVQNAPQQNMTEGVPTNAPNYVVYHPTNSTPFVWCYIVACAPDFDPNHPTLVEAISKQYTYSLGGSPGSVRPGLGVGGLSIPMNGVGQTDPEYWNLLSIYSSCQVNIGPAIVPYINTFTNNQGFITNGNPFSLFGGKTPAHYP